jgi:ribonuclease BN (tRNA processing enzyme)
MKVGIIYTHWHHDHTQGLFLAPHVFIPSTEIKVWGPKEHGVGPLEVFRNLMKPPLFPVNYVKIQHHIKTIPLCHVGTQVLVIHPKGGFNLMDIHRYRVKVALGKQLNLGDAHYPVEECLVIFMYKTEHPEYTVSYRFEEMPTGRVFVFLTDHENTASLPRDLLEHVRTADLLVQDGQYAHEVYTARAAGFGHGTPEYCAEVMVEAKAKRLGITHHDPGATDADVDKRVDEARKRARELGVADVETRIFGCADYFAIEV